MKNLLIISAVLCAILPLISTSPTRELVHTNSDRRALETGRNWGLPIEINVIDVLAAIGEFLMGLFTGAGGSPGSSLSTMNKLAGMDDDDEFFDDNPSIEMMSKNYAKPTTKKQQRRKTKLNRRNKNDVYMKLLKHYWYPEGKEEVNQLIPSYVSNSIGILSSLFSSDMFTNTIS